MHGDDGGALDVTVGRSDNHACTLYCSSCLWHWGETCFRSKCARCHCGPVQANRRPAGALPHLPPQSATPASSLLAWNILTSTGTSLHGTCSTTNPAPTARGTPCLLACRLLCYAFCHNTHYGCRHSDKSHNYMPRICLSRCMQEWFS